jgi:uncharacterized coiled-coil protein SlyX
VSDEAPLPDTGWEQRVESLEARVEHLERALEGLQDAVHRRSLQNDQQMEDMRRRTEPGQMARDMSEDARRRGLE